MTVLKVHVHRPITAMTLVLRDTFGLLGLRGGW
jgi:hypothetical protein